MQNERPNILFITADQMRWDAMGCMGDPVIKTPNIDRLAARGTLFRNAFTPNPICVPARASIMTGNQPQVCTGNKNNSGRIRDGQPLLTEILKSAGYRTYALGKLHFTPYSAPGEPRLVHGFEHVEWTESGRILAQYDPHGETEGLEDYFDYLKKVGYYGYSRAHGIGNNDVRPCRTHLPKEHTVDHWVADCTLTQIERHRREHADQPFFIWMSSPKPHSPYDPPDPYDKLYDPRDIPAPFGDEKLLDQKNPYIEFSRRRHAQESLSPQARQVIKAYYYGCITWMDAMIGRVMERLEQDDLLDNTLILFTADHGDLMGDFGAWFKSNHLNGSVRIPFIAAGPGVSRGMISEALVGLEDIVPTFASAAGASIGQDVQGHDIMPTLLGLCGIPIPSSVEGLDFSGYLAGGAEPSDGAALITCPFPFGQWPASRGGREYRGIRTARYTYVRDLQGPWLLYDNEKDPYQMRNLVNESETKSLREDLDRRLQAKLASNGDQFLPGTDYLKHWGYPVEESGATGGKGKSN
jgi:arylsulfatase A-like enzyme